MSKKTSSPRVSMDVAKHVLDSRPEKHVHEKLSWLENACRCIMAMDIDGQKYLMICGGRFGHHGCHEDVDGGVYWDRKK